MSSFLSDSRYESIRENVNFDLRLEQLVISHASHGSAIEEWRLRTPDAQPLELALLWLLVDDLDRSHVLCQDYADGLGAYIHGVVHRREGDFWNSKYWFRRTDVRLSEVNPLQFVDQVEARTPSVEAELIRLQRAEWLGLMDLVRSHKGHN
jgi:hypothetical protein